MLASLAALVLTSAVAFSEPQLVGSWPADGAKGVPAGEQTLVLEFSEPMARDRMSVTTGPAGAAPEFIGSPSFSEDGRTFRIRMRLRPGLSYAVGANSPSHMNFQNTAGQPVSPRIIRFTTAP